MLVDDVSMCLRSDKLIVQYGNMLCRKHCNNGDQTYHLSNKLRELGRLTLECRKCDSSITDLESVLHPDKFQHVLVAAKHMCGIDTEKLAEASPTLGIKMGTILRKITMFCKGEAIIAGDNILKDRCTDFHELLVLRWNDEIAKVARNELSSRKFNKPCLLPLVEDLQKLRLHLQKEISEKTLLLACNNGDVDNWRSFATAVLCSLILFNRRRGGEAALFTIKTFEMRDENIPNADVYASLSKFEKELVKKIKLVEVRGKRGRKVPILISKEMEKNIMLLINLRCNVGVNLLNPFIFAIPSGNSMANIRGNDAMRKHVGMIPDLRYPDAIRSTNLRKHIATMSQLLNLQDTELDLLANFMGHDISIHREFYRLPESTMLLAKCGKILLAMEKGEFQHGGSLDGVAVGRLGTVIFS